MKENRPNHPKPSLRFLKWFCPDHLYEEIEGDLIQKFNRDEKIFGEKKVSPERAVISKTQGEALCEKRRIRNQPCP